MVFFDTVIHFLTGPSAIDTPSVVVIGLLFKIYKATARPEQVSRICKIGIEVQLDVI